MPSRLIRKLSVAASSAVPKVVEYSSKVSSYIPTYDQHVHYERHLKYSRLRHLLIIPLVIWIIIYFSFPQIPNEAKVDPNVRAVSTIEKFLFFGYLPHQLLLHISNPFLDILCAIPYTMHIANPFIFVFLCLTLFKQRMTVLPFLHCLGALNILGMFIQYVFPTAPPWYYDDYGVATASYNMRGDPAGLQRVDDLTGTEFYNGMFSASTIVFGAFPSLHVGWAFLICLFVCSWDGWRKVKIFAKCYVALLSFAVVYLQHHYVLDVLGGLLCAYIAKKIVPMPPLSTSMVIVTTEVDNVPGVPMITTTTTMIPLQVLGQTESDIVPGSPIVDHLCGGHHKGSGSSISTQTIRSPFLGSTKYNPFKVSTTPFALSPYLGKFPVRSSNKTPSGRSPLLGPSRSVPPSPLVQSGLIMVSPGEAYLDSDDMQSISLDSEITSTDRRD